MTGVLLELSVKQELLQEFIATMKQIIPEKRKFKGCENPTSSLIKISDAK